MRRVDDAERRARDPGRLDGTVGGLGLQRDLAYVAVVARVNEGVVAVLADTPSA